jgi:hypothetical protein
MTNEVGVSTVCKHIVIIIIIIIIVIITIIITTTTTVITNSVLRQDHGFFQSEFSRECHIVVFFKFLCLLTTIYILVSLSSSSSCLYLLPLLPVPSTVPPIIYFRKQFLRKMWPFQLALLPFFV